LAKRGQRVVVKRGELDAVELDRTSAGAVETRHEIEQRRLADTRLAHDRNVVAGSEFQIDTGEDSAWPGPGVGLGQAMNHKHGCERNGRATR
jgi:hypothetical protein